MADLDDFFAKKDRKKKQTTKKFATTEEVAKKLEEAPPKKVEKLPKKEGDDQTSQATEQDEWLEFEEEKKDYTGLKIGNLTLDPNHQDSTSAEAVEAGSNSSVGGGDQPEGQESTDPKAGPWKRVDVPNSGPVEAPPPVVVKQPEPPASNEQKTYRPPSMRFAQATAPAQKGTLRGSRTTAPDIHNEDYFPTLGRNDSKSRKNESGQFETVQHRSARQQVEVSRNGGAPLNLGNRYTSLSNNDS